MSDVDARAPSWRTEPVHDALRTVAHLIGVMAGNVARAASSLELLLIPERAGDLASTRHAAPPATTAPAPQPARPARPAEIERLVGLLNRAADVVMVLDADATVLYVNAAVERALGYPQSEIVGTKGLEVLHADDVPVITGTLGALVARPGGSATFDFRALHKDGTWRWFETIAMNWLDDPEIRGIVLNARDVSERRSYEDDLRHRALHDTLTSLPNRTLLLDRLNGAISRSGRDANSVAVFFVDLDDFKRVNDTLGHAAGDDVLIGAAKRLAAAARTEDTVARFGGDEFVVVLEHDQEPEWVISFAERIRSIFSRPIQAGSSMATVTASIGIALSAGPQSDPSALLRDADAAMYRAKQSGGNAYVVFDDSMLDEPVIDLVNEDRNSIGENAR